MIINDVSIVSKRLCVIVLAATPRRPHSALPSNAFADIIIYRKLWWLDGKTHVTMANEIYHLSHKVTTNGEHHKVPPTAVCCNQTTISEMNKQTMFIYMFVFMNFSVLLSRQTAKSSFEISLCWIITRNGHILHSLWGLCIRVDSLTQCFAVS